MARKPARKAARKSDPLRIRPFCICRQPTIPTTEREKIIAAFLALLAEKPFEAIGLADIATAAKVSLAQLRGEFPSTLAIVAAHVKATDRAVLAEDLSDMAEEPARERLFDVLMRRLEALAPHREAIGSLLRSARRESAAGGWRSMADAELAAMDADRRRDRRVGPARHDPRPRPRRAVRVGSAHLDRR